jgi:hypothetical protein
LAPNLQRVENSRATDTIQRRTHREGRWAILIPSWLACKKQDFKRVYGAERGLQLFTQFHIGIKQHAHAQSTRVHKIAIQYGTEYLTDDERSWVGDAAIFAIATQEGTEFLSDEQRGHAGNAAISAMATASLTLAQRGHIGTAAIKAIVDQEGTASLTKEQRASTTHYRGDALCSIRARWWVVIERRSEGHQICSKRSACANENRDRISCGTQLEPLGRCAITFHLSLYFTPLLTHTLLYPLRNTGSVPKLKKGDGGKRHFIVSFAAIGLGCNSWTITRAPI